MWCGLLLSVSFFVSSVVDSASPDVRTSNGPVTGTSEVVDGRQVWQFLGLPFAEPPVASLRFRAPQPLNRTWTERLIANNAPQGCLQMPMDMCAAWPKEHQSQYGEDCLYLNIWTPTLTPGSKKSVMIWFYDGAFVSGEGLPFYNGKALSAIGDVVVVVPHYRVSIMGFARFDNKLVPGNSGLLDQQLAMKWVHENIAEFGGDPNSVTIFGESAGSGSVSYHMVNEESGKYFNRAIMQSGAIGPNLWSFNPNVDALEALNRKIVTQYLKCDQTAAMDLLKCLEGKSEEEMRDMVLKHSVENPAPSGINSAPTIDGIFLKDDPLENLRLGRINKKDLMIGLAEREGDFLLLNILQGMKNIMKLPDPVDSIITPDFVRQAVMGFIKFYPYYPHKPSPAALEMIVQRSYSHEDPTNTSLNAARLSETIGQHVIDCSVNNFADAVRRIHDRVYFFKMAHIPSQPLKPIDTFKWVKSSHGDEVPFVFAMPLIYPGIRTMTDEELLLSRRMIADWTNFARTGEPKDHNWKPFTLEKKEYFVYDLKSSLEIGGMKRNECAFWNKILPMINGLWCEKDSESNCNLANPRMTKPRMKDEL